ncbi:alpha/beta hydrolase family esterase [Corynebacterium resistens]|nr:alpha/beta fold hydrolase [Corynebacterium resistens]
MSVSGTKRNEGHEAGARGTVSRAATVVFLGMAVVFTIMAPAMHSDHAVSQNAESVGHVASGQVPWSAGQHASARNGESAVKQAAHTTGRLKRTAGYTHRTYELRTSTGRKRRVLVAIPTGVPRNKPLPVVLAFHAHNQYAENFATNAGLEGVAARAKAIVVYPQGVDRSWEGPTYARTHRGEDVRFARQALRRVSKEHALDWKRIYATGFSNGGGMALNMACQAPDLVAGVVGVSGAYYTPQYRGCAAGRVPTMLIHQSGDPQMRIDGGARNGMRYYSMVEMFHRVGARNGCRAAQIRSSRPAKGTVARQFSGCRAETKSVRIEGGWHRWESDRINVPWFVWSFLSRQHK